MQILLERFEMAFDILQLMGIEGKDKVDSVLN
jgi:hypothetical protein